MQCLSIDVFARDSNSQFTFEILIEFNDWNSVGNAVSFTAENLLLDSSTIYSVFLSFTRMFKVHRVNFQQKNNIKLFLNGCGV